MAKRRLTDKQKVFVKEYLIDLNASQAASRAGYSKKSFAKIGFQLLEKTRIQEEIQKALNRRAKRTKVNQDNVVLELAKLALSDMRSFVEWGASGVKLIDSTELSEEDTACIAEVSETVTKDGGSIKFKLHDKKGALELLGKHLGIFKEKVELTGKIEIRELSDEQLDSKIKELETQFKD